MSDSLYGMLGELGVGLHKCKSRRWYLNWLPMLGWIEVTERNGTLDAMWCNSKNGHDYIISSKPAFSVEVDQRDQIKWVFRSAISMWPVEDEELRQHYYWKMRDKVSLIIQNKQSA